METFYNELGEVDFTLDDNILEIEKFVLAPEYIGKGVAKEHMAQFAEFVQDEHFWAVKLSVFPDESLDGLDEDLLVKFYSKFGFTIYEYVIIDDREVPRMVATSSEFKELAINGG